MKILVTGATGFIGSVLCRRALEEGYQVIAVDDRSRGLNPVWDLPGINFLEQDCRNGLVDLTPMLTSEFKIDVVVHLAAGTGSLSRPLEELRALNVGMTMAVFHDALALGAKMFVFPTTSLAVGVPNSPYVISKEEGLAWLRSVEKDNPTMRLLLLRLFNVAGAYKGFTERRKQEVHMIPTMVEAFLAHTPFVINGDDYVDNGCVDPTDQTPARDFVHVVDVVDYILWLILRRWHGAYITTQDDGAVWVGTGQPTTVLQTLKIFRQWVGPLDHTIGPRRAFDVGFLPCKRSAVEQLARFRPPAPAWVAIRDEAQALLSDALIPQEVRR